MVPLRSLVKIDLFPPNLEYYCPIDLDSSLMILWYDMVTLHSIDVPLFLS